MSLNRASQARVWVFVHRISSLRGMRALVTTGRAYEHYTSRVVMGGEGQKVPIWGSIEGKDLVFRT